MLNRVHHVLRLNFQIRLSLFTWSRELKDWVVHVKGEVTLLPYVDESSIPIKTLVVIKCWKLMEFLFKELL